MPKEEEEGRWRRIIFLASSKGWWRDSDCEGKGEKEEGRGESILRSITYEIFREGCYYYQSSLATKEDEYERR